MSGAASVFVLSPDTRSERRYDLHTTVKQLKTKLESVTGIPADSQSIQLFNSEDEATSDGKAAAELTDDDRPLGFYGLRDWQALKVSDKNPSRTSLTGQFTDVSQVQKFELTEDEYAKRQDTVLTYKQQHKLGRFAPKDHEASPMETDTPEHITIGSRCEVDIPEDGMKKRGTVRFVGPTKFGKGGVWVGIEYDEPLGKNDGSVQGERYFSCRSPYGAFVRPNIVQVGDFPVEELSFDEEEM
ncbi:hypothetical protein BD410DRAFT_783837 [Rickenella mellea]|uniref:CAP-Gly domain-containing protein n=1 Tax=Rickenella mellea TaxID=50990 RepID=A0A4Y7QGA9_9AGAM|nr:hypothetical protein BD410DRAFT_783837 [Rickenella mellea]